jgi:hypothetical protein
MKKYLFIALAAAGMLSSCSSDDIVSNDDYRTNESLPVPIQIGVGKIASVTRGTGTVGSTDGALNAWKGQKIKVFMLNKDSLNNDSLRLAKDQYGVIYNNDVFTTPLSIQNTDSAIAKVDSKQIKYYPAQGNFDFYGYRLDGAERDWVGDNHFGVAAHPESVGDSVAINFEIDGSQDIMVAKAVPTTGDATTQARAYSAYSARHGLQPVLNFKHLLTRLVFNVIPGDSAVTKAGAPVFIDSILVKSMTKGSLTIAKRIALSGDQQSITWRTDTVAEMLYLKQRAAGATDSMNLVTLIPVSLAGKDSIDTADGITWIAKSTQIGEALLVQPGVESYDFEIYMTQTVPTSTDGSTPAKPWKNVYKTQIKPGANDGTKFQEGTSYNVNITVWGLEEINVTTKLTKWEDANDPIVVNGEDLGF